MRLSLQRFEARTVAQLVALLLVLFCVFRFVLPLIQEYRLQHYRLQVLRSEMAETAVFQLPSTDNEELFLQNLRDAELLNHLEQKAAAADLFILSLDWQEGPTMEHIQGISSLRIPLQLQGELNALRIFLDETYYPGLFRSLCGLTLERAPFLEEEYLLKLEFIYWGSNEAMDEIED